MSDPILNTTNVVNTNNIDQVDQIKEDNDVIDKKTEDTQKKLTSQDNIEQLGTHKKTGRLGKILKSIVGGFLLAAGVVAATVATVASLGIAPAAFLGISAAIGGITGTSITAGVTGLAGIACLICNFFGDHKTESFVDGQNTNANTNDNLEMIKNDVNNVNHSVHNNIVNNNAQAQNPNTTDYIKDSFENLKFYSQTVLTGRIEDEKQTSFLRKFTNNQLQNSVKEIVDNAFERASTDEIKQIIRNTFSQRTDIEKQLEQMNDYELKNVFMCCIFGNRDNSHNVFSCNTKSTPEDFIASIKSLVEFYVPVKEQIQIQENEEIHEEPIVVNEGAPKDPIVVNEGAPKEPVVANNKVPKDPEGVKKEEPENPKI